MLTETTTSQHLRDGIACVRGGDKARGQVLLNAVVEREPQNGLAWLWLASAVDSPREAIDCLRKVLAIDPQNRHATAALPDTLVRAGAAATKSGEKDKARAWLREATTLAPKNETAWLWRAGVEESAEEACKCLRAVLALNPSNSRARQGLSRYEAQVKPAWTCPLCEHKSFQAETVCPGCRAVVSLDNPAAFDRPAGLNRPAVEAAAHRLYAELTTKGTPDAAFALGLAYLNLGHFEEAISTLRSVSTGRGADSRSAVAVERLATYRAARAATTAVRPQVMVVDDSATVRKLVAATLSTAGYQVIESSDGYEAAERVRMSGAPRLFLLDVNMPGMDGFELCKLLRTSPETAKVPVIFLTGKDGFFNKLRGQWAGAAEYLTKPFDPDRLIKAVTKLVPVQAKG